MALQSFGSQLNAVVIGATGGIGARLATQLKTSPSVAELARLSRSRPSGNGTNWIKLDIEDEGSIACAAARLKDTLGELHLVIVATGLLHAGDKLQPEKSFRALTGIAMETAFRINTVGPALVGKHFLPLLAGERKTAFATLSARVGSITDNQLGGWHAYRTSKAALNMVIKTFSIELARRRPQALCVALHPGTVDTPLSQPFRSGLRSGQLFSSAQSARHLLHVLDELTPEQTGGFYAWDGTPIPF